MKVVIAGAGIAGNVMLRQLRHRPDVKDVKAYEKRSLAQASPPGLNVLMNHNGLAVVKEMDPELYAKFQQVGSDMRNWSARTVQGEILYHLPDVVNSGDAAIPAMVARWDHIHQATRCDDWTEYSTQVTDVVVAPDNKKLSVQIVREKETQDKVEEWIHDVDFVIAADGRYSTLRERLKPTSTYYGPPFVADFRIVVHGVPDIDDYLTPACPMWRVYHKPNQQEIIKQFSDHPAVVAAASGHVRVGIMKLDEGCLGMFGNVAIPQDGTLYEEIKSPELLAALFQPTAADNNKQEPDKYGKLVIDVLRNHGKEAHWTRKQQTETCYQALDGRVLFIGDAAGAIYPSLGQGANLSLEDAGVAAAAFPDVALISKLRFPRREFIKEMSRQHAMHVAFADTYPTEIANWADPTSLWRANLKRLWCPGSALCLRAEMGTRENLKPFGQLIAESLDGDVFDTSTNDAELDLSHGVPRFYLMKLTGGRPLRVDRITRHKKVTQCLGSIGVNEWFYLVVHAPSDAPTLAGLKAFCIPPRHFLKLHTGTWHAGPLWDGTDDERTFMNLELADTNVVDHDTVMFNALPPYSDETQDAKEPRVIPVMPVFIPQG